MILLLLLMNLAFAIDPKIDYQVLESKNFEIVYDARQKQQAKDYALQAERSFEILESFFGISPKKTVIVLDDTTDITNGSAFSVPRPTIYAYPVLPQPLSTIDHYNVWSKELIIHEFTHILNMEPARGIWVPFRFLFGSVIRPNMLLPRWYLEGLAVEIESRFTTHGRLRSTDYIAMIRSEVLDNTWGKEDIARINEVTIPAWPRGQRPYYYGALLWHELAQQKGPEIFKNWNNRYAGRIPYFIEGPAEDDFGKNFQAFLNDVYEKYGAIAQRQLDEISKGDVVTKGPKINIKSESMSHSPSISPDQTKLGFISILDTGDSVIQIIDRSPNGDFDSKPITISTGSDTSRIAWFPDSQKFIYDKADTFDRFSTFFDLYIYDLKKKESKQLTFGERAFNAQVSPDGSKIVYVRSEAGYTKLFIIDTDGSHKREIFNPGYQVRINSPGFINNNEIIFSERQLGGDEFLKVLNLSTSSSRVVLSQYSGSQFPVVTKSGVIFTNNKSGVDNLFITDFKFESVKALTNSQTKILNGTVDSLKNKIYYSHLNSKGFSIEKNDVPSGTIGTPKIENELANSFPNEYVKESNSTKVKSSKYSPISYLFPQYWLPSFFILPEGFLAGATVSGSDPLSLHTFSLGAEYDSRSQQPSGMASYLLNSSIGMFELSGFYLNSYSSAFENTAIKSGGSLTYSNYIWGLSNNWESMLGWAYSMIDDPLLSDVHTFHGPKIGFAYNDTSQKGYQISPVGKKFTAQYTYYLPNPTNTEHDVTLFSGTYFHSKWLPENNVFMMRAQAYYTKANRSALLGTMSLDGPPIIQVGEPNFIMRGYPIGEFIAWQAYQGTVEYRFPVAYPYSGSGTFPLFLKRIHASLFGDFMNMNGVYFQPDGSAVRERNKKFFPGYGAEVTFDLTVFYHVPIYCKFGFGYGAVKEANGSSTIYALFGL